MPKETKNNTVDLENREYLKRPLRILRHAAIGLGLVVLLACFILAGGLFVFTGYVLLASERTPQGADAIVVVTGGAGRLNRAATLLKEGKGKKLLVSGVHPLYSAHTLEKNFELSPDLVKCCIDLDRMALNTVANATQTALWAKENGFSSLIIVTSAYHMPRTMLEMQRAAPDLHFQSDLVATPNPRSVVARLLDWNNVHLLTKEYGKLLASLLHGTSERLHSRIDTN